MDLQPFAQVLSQDLVQDDLTLQSSQNRGHAGSYQRLLFSGEISRAAFARRHLCLFVFCCCCRHAVFDSCAIRGSFVVRPLTSRSPVLNVCDMKLHETGLPLWSCILALCHHVYWLPGAVWSLLALVLSQDLVPFVHSMDLQPSALS